MTKKIPRRPNGQKLPLAAAIHLVKSKTGKKKPLSDVKTKRVGVLKWHGEEIKMMTPEQAKLHYKI